MSDLDPIRGTPEQTEILKQLIIAAGSQRRLDVARPMNFVAQEVAIVKCGAVRDADDGIYNGTVRLLNAELLEWADQPAPCWIMDANGNDLIPDSNYPSIRYGMLDLGAGYSGAENRPVYVTGGSGGGSSTRIVHIVADADSPYSDGTSPNCFYSAALTTIDPTVAGFVTDSTSIWYGTAYNFAACQSNGQALCTNDGSVWRFGINSGQTWNPATKGERPLWVGPEFMKAWSLDCSSGAPFLDVQ
jgi:hypothetical protein